MSVALPSRSWLAVWRRNYLVWKKLAAESVLGNIVEPLFYLAGFGIGIGRTLLVADAMRAGQLVCPFGPALTLAGNYYVVCPEITAMGRHIVAFRDWVVAEAHASAASIRVPRRR